MVIDVNNNNLRRVSHFFFSENLTSSHEKCETRK